MNYYCFREQRAWDFFRVKLYSFLPNYNIIQILPMIIIICTPYLDFSGGPLVIFRETYKHNIF